MCFLQISFELLVKDEEISPATRPAIKDIKKKKSSFDVEVLITLWPKISKLPNRIFTHYDTRLTKI